MPIVIDVGPAVSEPQSFEDVGTARTDGRTDEHCVGTAQTDRRTFDRFYKSSRERGLQTKKRGQKNEYLAGAT